MTIETFLVKRPARYAKEVGLFPDSPAFQEDFDLIPIDTEVRAELATERNIKMLRFAWVLAGIVADNTEYYVDKIDAMDGVDPPGLKVLARHCKTVIDRDTGEVSIRPMSLKRLSNEAFLRLIRRMVFVVSTKIIPGLDEGPLRAEIEEIVRDKREPRENTNGR